MLNPNPSPFHPDGGSGAAGHRSQPAALDAAAPPFAPRSAAGSYGSGEILRAFGTPPSGPTLLGTDNLANQKVAMGIGAPTRSKHFLRRYYVLKQRISAGEVVLKHVDDPSMPADFLTKWIHTAKLEQSLRYATNSRNSLGSLDGPT